MFVGSYSRLKVEPGAKLTFTLIGLNEIKVHEFTFALRRHVEGISLLVGWVVTGCVIADRGWLGEGGWWLRVARLKA